MYRIFKILGVFMVCFFMASPVVLEAKIAAQIMSSKDKSAAQAEADKLVGLGIPAFTKTGEVADRGVWTRVFLGPFETTEDAEAAAEVLKKQGTIRGYVVKANPGADVVSTGADEADLADPIPAGSPGAGLAEPAKGLPAAQAPTYGEPMSPQQAKELGLAGPAAKTTTVAEPAQAQAPVPPVRSNDQTEAEPPVTIKPLVTIPSPSDVPAAVKPLVTIPSPSDVPATVKPLVSAKPAVVPTPAQTNQPQTPETMPTYGQAEANPPQLPVGLASGDDLPGLAPPASPSGSVPASTPPEAAVAPSTGEGDAPLMMAQAEAYYVTSIDQPSQLPMVIAGFTCLVDLSTSMRRLVDCGARVKEEAVASLMRKINQRIPNHPYNATLRVFGYKMAMTRKDFTTVYYGPEVYNRGSFEAAISRLAAADSVSPFATAINSADSELMVMGSPKAVLMFSDFEESVGSGNAVRSAENLRRRYGQEVKIYTYYASRQKSAAKLAKAIAQAGHGEVFNICEMLDNEAAFTAMMTTVFGPSDAIPCPDADGDGVCDADDICGNTPPGAPVDNRGCWIAAYSQFFDFDKDVVKSAFLPRIKNAAEIIHRNPNLPMVTIAGNTDNIGNPEYNIQLGLRRAQAVKDILVQDGVNPARLKVVSFGETRPVADNNTEEGRARNRRVEFHIGDIPNN